MPSFRELYRCVNHRNYVRNSEPVILAHDLGVEDRLLQGHGSAHQNAVTRTRFQGHRNLLSYFVLRRLIST
jgi:hypothetical protein